MIWAKKRIEKRVKDEQKNCQQQQYNSNNNNPERAKEIKREKKHKMIDAKHRKKEERARTKWKLQAHRKVLLFNWDFSIFFSCAHTQYVITHSIFIIFFFRCCSLLNTILRFPAD